MKSEDIQEALRGLRAILQLYPGCDIDDIVRDIKRLKKFELDQSRSCSARTQSRQPSQELDSDNLAAIDGFVAGLDSLSISEIESELKSDRLFPTMHYLRYFAEKIGLDLASRQAKAISIHAIKAFLDRTRIESTMAKRVL